MNEREPEETIKDLEQRSERVEEDIEDTKKDWEGKKKDEQVPGAVPESDDEA